MEITTFLNENPFVGILILGSFVLGILIGVFAYNHVTFGKLGSLGSFLKKGNYYYACKVIGETGDNPIWVIKKVTLNGTTASYSRKFYLRPYAVAPFQRIPLKTVFKIDSKEYYISPAEISKINISIPQFRFSGIPEEN